MSFYTELQRKYPETWDEFFTWISHFSDEIQEPDDVNIIPPAEREIVFKRFFGDYLVHSSDPKQYIEKLFAIHEKALKTVDKTPVEKQIQKLTKDEAVSQFEKKGK